MKNSILIALLMVFSSLVSGQELTATVSKNQVAVGEQFVVSFRFNSKAATFQAPKFAGFRITSGPNRQSDMRMVNGRVSSSITFSYYLLAQKEGTFTIEAATASDGQNEYKSKPVNIKVVKGKTKQQQANGNDGKPSAKELFIKLRLNKSKVHKGEQLIATYQIYSSVNLVNLAVEKDPDFNGFWSQVVESKINEDVKTEVVNGVRYNVYTLNKTILFPQRTGKLTVDPYAVELTARMRDNRRQRNVFDSPFWGRYKEVKHVAKSNEATVEVLPHPAQGQPETFSGTVGRFTFNASLDNTEVKANEGINLKITIEGSGNIKLLESLDIDFPPDFEVYDPNITDRVGQNNSGMAGKRTFEYLIIPRHAGDYTIDPIVFSYFDPIKDQYVSLSSEAFEIHVNRGENEDAATASGPLHTKKAVERLNRDIRFIKVQDLELSEHAPPFFGSAGFFGLLGLPFLLLALFLPIRKMMQDRAADTHGSKIRKANKVAHKHLSEAEGHLKAGNRNAFYESVFKSMYGYLSDKLSIPVSTLNKETILSNLQDRQVSPETIDRLIAALDRCEMARFAPIDSAADDQTYQEATALISQLESSLK